MSEQVIKLKDFLDYSKKALLLEYNTWYDDYKKERDECYAACKQWCENDKDRIEKYNVVNDSLEELSDEIERLEISIRAYNRHSQRDNNKVQDSKREVDKGLVKINELIVRINEELATYRSAGETRVEHVRWWIPRAAIVCVAGGLILAASFAVTAPVTAWFMLMSGLTAAVGGGGTVVVCHNKVENIKADKEYLTNSFARLERLADKTKSEMSSVQPEDGGPTMRRRT